LGTKAIYHLCTAGLTFVSVANVLTEHLYKRTGEVPLHKQNVLLYTCGVCFNGVAFVLFAPSQSGGGGGFFHGYSGWTVLVIMSQGISGYLVGALFKYIDAIAAIYADLAVSATDRLSDCLTECMYRVFFSNEKSSTCLQKTDSSGWLWNAVL
jgi:hypothetical protein